VDACGRGAPEFRILHIRRPAFNAFPPR